MRIVIAMVSGLLVILACGCAPSGDVSGWELVPKTDRVAQMEVFPEIPVQLPDTTPYPRTTSTIATSPMTGLFIGALDEGSLFRRGYSAPTP